MLTGTLLGRLFIASSNSSKAIFGRDKTARFAAAAERWQAVGNQENVVWRLVHTRDSTKHLIEVGAVIGYKRLHVLDTYIKTVAVGDFLPR
jgi:hypothetical protein